MSQSVINLRKKAQQPQTQLNAASVLVACALFILDMRPRMTAPGTDLLDGEPAPDDTG